MTFSDGKYVELADLLTLLCDGQLGQPELDRLERLLLDDPEAQEFYRQYVALDVELGWNIAGARAISMLQLPTSSAPSTMPEPPAPPVLGFLGSAAHGGVGLFRRGLAVGVSDRHGDFRHRARGRHRRTRIRACTDCQAICPSPLSPLPCPLCGRPDHRHGRLPV